MTEKSERAGGILGDFSVSQLLATALAAATSFALSTQIGVAGSIIGAVVGAVASAVATQVYRNILASSAEKLRAIDGARSSRRSRPRAPPSHRPRCATPRASASSGASVAAWRCSPPPRESSPCSPTHSW